MDEPLYVERWLLDLKAAATAAGLQAHVRALDVKGGDRLSLQLRAGGELVELRYRKRRTGASQLAAATGATIAARARELHRRQLEHHSRLLENGRRRFLRRSVVLLAAVEAAFSDSAFAGRARTTLASIQAAAGVRPAVAARVGGTLRRRIEVLPAAALSHGASTRIAGLQDGKVVDLSELLPRRKRRRADESRSAGDAIDAWSAVDLLELGVELVPSAARNASDAAQAPEVAGAAAEAAGSIVPDIVAATAEVAAEGGSWLGDAACAGIDCGGLDCLPG